MTKKVLICGASGFIGRNLADSLSKDPNYEVTGVVFKRSGFESSNIRFVTADLTKQEDVDRVVKGQDIILQFAATTSGSKDIVQRPFIHVTDNALMNSLLIRSAFENEVSHFVFPSCTVMYRSSDKLIKEDDFDPTNGVEEKYFGVAWTKVYIEKQCEFFSKLGKTKFTVMRHSNVYGPHDKYDLERSHVCGATITKVSEALDGSSISMWGTGEEERDLLHVDDIVDFVKLAILKQSSKFELMNVGLGSSVSVLNLAKLIINASGKNIKIDHDLSKPTIKTKVALNIDKAKNTFGWLPKISLEEGILRTIQWYKQEFVK